MKSRNRKIGRPETTYFWKVALILMGLAGLSAGLIKSPGFWTSYALDIAGPAMGYILIRGTYKSDHATFLSVKFSPEWAATLILGICIFVEASQYFQLYDAHFDPYDFLAYISGVAIFYTIDKLIIYRKLKSSVG